MDSHFSRFHLDIQYNFLVMTGKERPPWERFNDWVHSICVVTFDLELGQALEVIYPGDAVLSDQEKTNICYLAFPDSNSGTSKDTNFHFRIRRGTAEITSSQAELLKRSSQSSSFDPYYLYGFVHFRQQKDPSIRRGYYQKSLVLITLLPFFNLFSLVIERIALQFFINGEPAIEAACHDIDQWPSPCAGEMVSLPLLGYLLRIRIPCQADLPLDSRLIPARKDMDTLAVNTVFLRSVHEIDIYQALHTVINHLQLLWELVLIGEPLLVMANTPQRCSSIVQALVSLITPLKYYNDYRPFFTIHDSEFKEYSTRSRPIPHVILGVTNPFFIKALDHWPHILKVGEAVENSNGHERQEKTRKNWDGRTLDTKAGFYTHYKTFLNKDKSVAKKLLKGDRPSEIQCSILRRHFLELTQSFMIPLERYLSSLMPLRKEMSPFKAIPSARPFSIDEFLLTIEDSGPSLTCGIKGDWPGLYRRFVTSANFTGWLAHRNKDVNIQLKAQYVEALCSADFGSKVLATKHHVEIVDLVLRVRQRIIELEEASEKRHQLVDQIISILSGVDEELKQVLMSNCSLREIVS
ncbi:hypothetical protein DICVIV_04992 [Dictyocaulus viviparus]|uniref:UDENN domain-containing protein n=1 Tax=Dictyocaulus viviparus TaxID=29172 RepID=A0A0D8Y2S0_DICVI|nr:hypothetical protein DICVIV_04992 [Dictyocaulus viviparus]